MKIKKEEIKKGLKEAYKEAGHNAYFGDGFEAGVRFALEIIAKENNNNSVCLVINKSIDRFLDSMDVNSGESLDITFSMGKSAQLSTLLVNNIVKESIREEWLKKGFLLSDGEYDNGGTVHYFIDKI